SKFKVGDRVVVVKNNHPIQAGYLSERGEVVAVSDETEYEVSVRRDGRTHSNCFDSSELEFEHIYDALSSPASKVEKSPSGDVVNHPSHYADGWSNGAEVIDITEHLNFNRGNAVKYLARAGKKGGSEKELEDLQKALWYVRREVLRLGGTV